MPHFSHDGSPATGTISKLAPIGVSSRERGGLAIVVCEQGTTTSIELDGCADAVAVPQFRDAVATALGRGPQCVVLDLRRLSSIDDAAVTVVIELVRRAETQAAHVVIFPGPAAVQAVFVRREISVRLPFLPAPTPPDTAAPSSPELSWTTIFSSFGY